MTVGTPDSPSMPGSKIGDRYSSLRDQVLDALRERIVNGEYAPGERLIEGRLASEFGVSRNPIREALRVVETEGFVHSLPRRGLVVATPDRTTMRDMFVVRRQLETLAGRLAAERANADDVAGLWVLLEEARLATERQDLQSVSTLNTMLHQRVVDVANNRWLSALNAPLTHHMQWVFRLSAARRAPHSWTEHVRLVEAIEAGDVAAAELAAGQHVDAAAHAAEVWDEPEA